jgi:integrase
VRTLYLQHGDRCRVNVNDSPRPRRLHIAERWFVIDGRGWHPDVMTRAFARLVKRSGLPRLRLHDLRHTHATHLLAAGTNVRVTSERLGHASVAFTLDVYGHVLPGQQADAAAAVAALVDR